MKEDRSKAVRLGILAAVGLIALWLPGVVLVQTQRRLGGVWLCAVAALELIGLGIWLIFWLTAPYRRCTEPAQAKVLFNVRSRMRDKKWAFQPVMTYPVDGKALRTAGRGRPMPLTEGAFYHVLYDPDRPEHFLFVGSKPDRLPLCGAAVLILLGVVCGIAGIVLLFSGTPAPVA